MAGTKKAGGAKEAAPEAKQGTPNTGVEDTEAAAADAPELEQTAGEEQPDLLERGRNVVETAGQGDDAKVVKSDDKISDYEDVDGDSSRVRFTADVVEEFHYPNTTTPSHRILFTKGQVVPRSQVDALNANV